MAQLKTQNAKRKTAEASGSPAAPPPSALPTVLGIECGATRTVAVLDTGAEFTRREFGPANLKLMDQARLAGHFHALARSFPQPAGVAIGMAGARTAADRAAILWAADQAWPGVPCHAGSDLETGLAAAGLAGWEAGGAAANQTKPRHTNHRDGEQPPQASVLVLSGTGSCCFGRTREGKSLRFGGWGHVLGDRGSGYEVGLEALRTVVYEYDRTGQWPPLGRRLLRRLQLNEPNDLVEWAQQAGKPEVAGLAMEVFNAAARRERIARKLLAHVAAGLANSAAACARRLVHGRPPVRFILAGSLLLKQPGFARQVSAQLRRLWPRAIITPLERESVWGAVALARKLVLGRLPPPSPATGSPLRANQPDGERPLPGGRRGATAPPDGSVSLPPTEHRHPRSRNLDRMPLRTAIALMLSEDARIPQAILAEHRKLEQLVRIITRALKRGGRLFYVGAGTSGRLGVLDASECPPTFGVSPEKVQGIIAGGQRALWESVEGAEDDAAAGGQALVFRGLNRHDVVVGLTASGQAPFVWGALAEAKLRRAKTCLICCNPQLIVARAQRPDIIIAPATGPELLTGSTRLKAGTATKLILNLLTTLTMVRLGKVTSNLMVDLHPANTKLRERAVRIVQELTGMTASQARTVLEKCGWVVKRALKRRQNHKSLL